MIEFSGKTYVPDPAIGEMPKLSKRQKDKLKESLQHDGQEARVYLRKTEDPKMMNVIDGWHRLVLLIELGESPKFRMYPKCTTDDEVREIAERLQAGRRQTSDDWRLSVGREYNQAKQAVGRPKSSETAKKPKITQNGLISTAERIADEHGVSKNTVVRAGKRAAAYDKLTSQAKKVVEQRSLSDDQVVSLATKSPAEQNDIANDLRKGIRTKQEVFPPKLSCNGKPKKKTAKKKLTPSEHKRAVQRDIVSRLNELQRLVDDYHGHHCCSKLNQTYCIKRIQEVIVKVESWK